MTRWQPKSAWLTVLAGFACIGLVVFGLAMSSFGPPATARGAGFLALGIPIGIGLIVVGLIQRFKTAVLDSRERRERNG